MPPEVATLGGRYVLKEPISRGGMATVWRAHDDVLARTVAVKVLHPHLGEDEAFLERFRREALAAARLTHPNVVGIFDTGSDTFDGAEQHYIVMEYCSGGTLADVLAREGAMDVERVAGAGVTICDALGYAHRIGVIHRDVKPANVLIGPDGTLKVGDFGIAKAAFTSNDVTTTGSILGTVTYLSPEQAKGEEPTASSDLYSLGVVLYELAAGRPPFQGETQIATAMKHIHEEPQPLRSLRAGIPKGFETVVMRALAKDPERRYSDAGEMQRALESASGGGGGTTTAFPVPDRSVTPVPTTADGQGGDLRWIVKVLLAVLVLVGGVVAVSALTNQDEDSPNGGASPGPQNGGAAGEVRIVEASDFDPYGEDGEHPEDAHLAHDGNDTTTWTTSDYDDALSLIKPGVGLLFDLGTSAEVGSVEITGSAGMSLEIRASEQAPSSEADADLAASETGVPATIEIELDEPAEGRYWIVWITDLPGGGGGSASIAEVRFRAP